MKNIILIGFSSTGKSTVGRRLATRFGYAFIDIDDVVQKLFRKKTRNSLSCRDIVRLFGNEEFRSLENEALRSLAGSCNTVIATGGGAPMPSANRTLLHDLGTIVYLSASPEVILQRMRRKGAPVFMRSEDGEPDIHSFMARRDPIYREIADLVVETSELDPESSSTRIAFLIENPE